MQINKSTLIFIPFLTMFLACLITVTNPDQGTTISFSSENVTVNGQEGNVNVQPIDITSLILITILIAVALAVCLVVGIQVLGSGISGSVIPIIFVVTIMSGVYGVLSALSINIFMSIPYFGIPIYFILLIMYIIGLTGFASGSTGD
jgi:hypothetical protein